MSTPVAAVARGVLRVRMQIYFFFFTRAGAFIAEKVGPCRGLSTSRRAVSAVMLNRQAYVQLSVNARGRLFLCFAYVYVGGSRSPCSIPPASPTGSLARRVRDCHGSAPRSESEVKKGAFLRRNTARQTAEPEPHGGNSFRFSKQEAGAVSQFPSRALLR
ncbi:hypothetical protein SKAU_G00072410 [Synaphobranchus kaupii]|uniref:Uncharacterized protein n=1 Tax=Synaphobranchus kaupii TaxID=118154 RepID=A0A9Q1G7G9_SYNKA|nr:hypothetical protein SKAU_G00072410 [Synaphobranchus kaupii]